MKGRYLVYILLSFVCLFPYDVNAECDYQRKAELSRIASNVQVSYNYDQDNNFTVNITNLTDDIYIKDDYDVIIEGAGEKNFNYSDGEKIKYRIFSNDNNCKDEELLTKYVNLPIYNLYSNYDECKMYPEFQYCQKWLSTSITTDQFSKRLNEYVKDNSNSGKSSKTEDNVLDVIVEFFKNNILILILFSILIFIIIVIILFKKIRSKKERLI